jgi:multicomponent K+:H+ antiporter subunit D
MSHMIIAPVLIPLFAGVIMLIAARSRTTTHRTLSLLSTAALVPVTINLFCGALTGDIDVYHLGDWQAPFGIVLVLDQLAAWMLLLTAALALPALVYACRGDDLRGPNFHALFQFQLMGLNGAFLTGDLFNLFVFFEVLLIASYGLLLHGGGRRRTAAGLHYVVINLAGSALFLIALGLLYGTLGTLNMADMALRVRELSGDTAVLVRTAALVLLLVFAIKAALVPLYFWLPRAYASATAPVAALFAIMTKVGIYAVMRVYSLIFGESAGELAGVAEPWLWPAALLTLALGGLGALAADRLAGQVAWLVIMSVGTLLTGVCLGTEEASAAVLYYLVHSTLAAAVMFLIADMIARQRGPLSDRLHAGPPLNAAGRLGALYLLGAMAVIGMPPLSGFLGKVALMQAAPGVALYWTLLLAGSLMALIALSRAGSTLFWRTRGTAAVYQPDRSRQLMALALLGLITGLTVLAQPVLELAGQAAAQLHDPGAYIDAVLPREGR